MRFLFQLFALSLLLPVLGVNNARGETSSSNIVAGKLLTDDEIKATLRDCIVTDQWGVGMVVGIVDEHGTRVISYGKLDNGDSPEVNGDTLFEIGSITKTFTVLLLEDMVQRGEMKPDDPVEKYLPASVKDDDPAWGVVKSLRVEFRLGGKVQTAEVKEGESLKLTAGTEVLKAGYGNLSVPDQTVDVTEKIVVLARNGALSVRAENALAIREVALKVPAMDGRKITLLDLATHTSGLPRDMGDGSVPGMYKFLSHCRLLSKPGSKVLYSNFGMALLAHAIELKAGTNYEALVQQRICQPLGMSSTCIKPTPELRPRWSKSHGQENRATWDFDAFCGPLGGAGAIRSSVNDMLKYAAAEMGLTDSPLTPLMEKTHAIQIRHAFGEADLALPWWIYHWDGEELITHGGNTGGQTAFMGFDKKLKRAVVVLANRNDAHDQAVHPLGLFLLCPSPTKPVPVKVASEILDSYAGLYEFTDVPLGIMIVRHDGDRLNTWLLNSARGDWFPQSKTEFALDEGRCDMKFNRGLTGRTKVVFLFQNRVVAHACKISDDAPDSLLQPMLQPLAAGECGPRPDSDLQGKWEGTLRPWFWPFHAHRGMVRIAEPSPGTFRAEFDYPEQRANNQPLSVIYHAPEVALVLRSGEAMFKGTINRDHSKMTGHLIQDGHSVRVTIRRADPKPVAVAAKNEARKD
jgi:serine-type D-Ala-D-Ala carboxypeptidase/endopeptidase